MNTLPNIPITQTANPFLPIYLESLVVDSVLGFDLFIKLGREMILYRSKQLPFTDSSRKKLLDNKVDKLYVPVTSKQAYQTYIESNLGRIIQDPSIHEEKKAGIIYEASKTLVKDVLANPSLGENIQRSKDMVANQVSYILKGRDAFLNLMRISSFDYYTYTHSVNVCTFAIALANQLGINDTSALRELGLGALLHDVGKSRVSERILNKRAPLNRAEFEIVKKHPEWGLQIVKESSLIADKSCYAIIQHHERVDGSGYPFGLLGKHIHVFGRIIAVCDVFDALTTRRVYQNALETYPAFRVMYSTRREFDEEILREFTVLMGPDNGIRRA
jgi:putative nucleotidyltransferase with HDIG domain